MKSLVIATALAAVSAASPQKPEFGMARVEATQKSSALAGTARFEEVKGGLKVVVNITGVPDGEHAMHIHEYGDCGDEGRAAGTHFNPDHAPHGHAVKDGKKAHPGDLGNVTARDGQVALEIVLPRASLTSGKRSVAGRSIVLHEKVDDFSQPTGNAGGRIACGVIVLVDK